MVTLSTPGTPKGHQETPPDIQNDTGDLQGTSGSFPGEAEPPQNDIKDTTGTPQMALGVSGWL